MNRKQAEKWCENLGLDANQLVSIGDGMWTFSELQIVSSEKAIDWLKRFNTPAADGKKDAVSLQKCITKRKGDWPNRNKKDRTIEELSTAILKGHWYVSHQGIAFMDEEDRLGDGQNRLMAIAQAGRPTPLRIFLGLTRQALMAVDNGVVRTTNDLLSIQNWDVQKKVVSAMNFFIGGITRMDTIHSDIETMIEYLKKYRAIVDFMLEHLPIRGSTNVTAPIRAAVMRALYVRGGNDVDREKIQQFCGWLPPGSGAGIPAGFDYIGKYRDYVIDEQDYGATGRYEVYAYTEEVLLHWLDGDQDFRFRRVWSKKNKTVKRNKTELFLIPELDGVLGESLKK